MELQHFTKEQLADIVKGIKAIAVDGLPVFSARIINAHSDRPIGLDHIQSSGMVYIKVSIGGTVSNFPVWVDVD